MGPTRLLSVVRETQSNEYFLKEELVIESSLLPWPFYIIGFSGLLIDLNFVVKTRKVSGTVSYFKHEIRATGAQTWPQPTRAYSMAKLGKPENMYYLALWLTDNPQ